MHIKTGIKKADFSCDRLITEVISLLSGLGFPRENFIPCNTVYLFFMILQSAEHLLRMLYLQHGLLRYTDFPQDHMLLPLAL